MYEKWMSPAPTEAEAFTRLMEIVRILRQECPWDREQTHASIRKGMLEEAYEVAEAIDKEDMPNLREELGDVLLQVVFHSILAQEEKAFDMTEVINEECEKMIRRHPHVFGEEESKTVDKVLEKWENIKAREHGEMSVSDRIAGVPNALPALIRSFKVQKRAEESGWHWDDGCDPWQEVSELSGEFVGGTAADDPVAAEEKIGRMLFCLVQAARHAGIEPERALELTTEDFIRSFTEAEDGTEP